MGKLTLGSREGEKGPYSSGHMTRQASHHEEAALFKSFLNTLGNGLSQETLTQRFGRRCSGALRSSVISVERGLRLAGAPAGSHPTLCLGRLQEKLTVL